MISIKKPEEAPKILREKGKAETETLCEDYLKNKADYESGKKKFEFKKSIYGGKSVKNAFDAGLTAACQCPSRRSAIGAANGRTP